MTKGSVNRILPFSSVDGPGNRTVIFMQGCNFNCLYCHNPETIKRCMDSMVSVEEVVEEVKRVKSFISGITVSGGECTLQASFLTLLFQEMRKLGLTTFVDTNGSVPFYEKKELVEVMDMAMVDLKAFDNNEHERLTGQGNLIVMKNIEYLAKIGKLYEIRTVIVPGLLNNMYNVDETSKLIAFLDCNIRYKIIKYRPIGVRLDKLQSTIPTDRMMQEVEAVAIKNGCKNVIIV